MPTHDHAAGAGKSGAVPLVRVITLRDEICAAILTFCCYVFHRLGHCPAVHGNPWLLIASMGRVIGTFIKYGCLSQLKLPPIRQDPSLLRDPEFAHPRFRLGHHAQ